MKINQYNQIKEFEGKKYTGMKIGGSHEWNYNDNLWQEEKVEPDLWRIKFTATKRRTHSASINTGCEIGTQYNWLIVGQQRVIKINENEYQTVLEGNKWKIGYKKPSWRDFSYNYKDQKSEKQQIIDKLNEELRMRQ